MRNLSTINESEDILTVEALTLSSNTTNAILLTIGNTTQSISQATLRTSLGLGTLAYKSSLVENDIPSLSISKITNLQSTLDAKALKARKITAGTGLTGGGTLEADRTLSLATSGVTAGTYKSVTVDTYGRVTAGTNPTTLSGYGITDAATKTELAATDTELGVTNDAVAAIDQRVSDIEQWAVNPTLASAYIKDCAVDAINLGGVDVWNEGEVVKIGGGLNIATLLKVGTYLGINVDPSTSYRLYVNGDSRLEGKTYIGGTTYYLNGTSGWSYLPVLNLGGLMGSGQTHKLYVSGTSYFAGAITTGSNMAATFQGTTSVTKDTELSVGSNFAGTTAALKVTGGLAIGNNLAVLGKKIYFDNSHYIELDGNGYLHTNVGFYSDSFVASGGIGNAGGGGSSVNVKSYSEIPSIQSEVMTDVPSAYALKQVYDSVSGLSSSLGNIISGATPLNNPTVNVGNSLRFRSYDGSSYTTNNGFSWDTWTASSTSYSGILSSQDIRLASGKALFLTQGNGSTVKRAVYSDSSGNINIGSSGDSILIKGASYYTPQSTLSESSSNVPTSNAVVNYLNDQMRATNNAVAAVRRSLDDVLAWKVKPTAREMTVGTLGITDGINLGGVDVWYNGSQVQFGGDIRATSIIAGGLKYPYNGTNYDVLTMSSGRFYVGNTSYPVTLRGSSVGVSGATTFSNAVTINSSSIGGADHLVFNRAAINYIRASASGGSFSFIPNGLELASANAKLSINSYGIAVNAGATAANAARALYVNGDSVLTGTLLVGSYYVHGKKAYNLTSFFALAQGATFNMIDDSSVESFLSDIQNGYSELYVKGSVTLNGVSYTPRYDVQVGATTGQDISLYYVKLGSTPPLTFELLQFSYSGGAWKITNRISKSIS